MYFSQCLPPELCISMGLNYIISEWRKFEMPSGLLRPNKKSERTGVCESESESESETRAPNRYRFPGRWEFINNSSFVCAPRRGSLNPSRPAFNPCIPTNPHNVLTLHRLTVVCVYLRICLNVGMWGPSVREGWIRSKVSSCRTQRSTGTAAAAAAWC